ncbi:hypothetical protein [Streptomyces sp. NPDC087525]|uniref:hypothetical protein n=1 Tax=Streptomyces sp. NPDC087525 TaxID=3365793 RepID=UPI00380CA614
MKIVDFAAPEASLSNWRDHLALWARQRNLLPNAKPLDECVVDLRAPQLELALLTDRTGLAKIAGMPPDEQDLGERVVASLVRAFSPPGQASAAADGAAAVLLRRSAPGVPLRHGCCHCGQSVSKPWSRTREHQSPARWTASAEPWAKNLHGQRWRTLAYPESQKRVSRGR